MSTERIDAVTKLAFPSRPVRFESPVMDFDINDMHWPFDSSVSLAFETYCATLHVIVLSLVGLTAFSAEQRS